MQTKFSIILPTYNEGGNIIKLIKEIKNVFKKTNKNFEIIVVDDNSEDNTEKLVKNFLKKNKFVKFFSRKKFRKNLAQSIQFGISKSKNDNVIWLDADFQHPPKYIKKFIKKIKYYDVIIYSMYLRFTKKGKSFHDNSTSILNKFCNKFLFNDFTDFTSGFICIKKKCLNDFNFNAYYGEYFINLLFHIKLKKYKFIELPFKESKRYSGYSKTTHSKINYIIKSYFYFLSIFKNLFNKLSIKN